MSNYLRRLPLSRLLLLCGVVIAVGVGVSALAVALGTGPTPPPKPLAEAVHDALAAPPVDGVSARIQFTNHLIEASSLQSPGSGGENIAMSPLLTGASGRLWIAGDGRVRVELQAEQGDSQILYDGNTITFYDGSANTLYRYALPQHAGSTDPQTTHHGQIPTVTEIQETITNVMRHATLSGAVPTDVAGQAAYSVRISPSHDGGLVGGAELAWDAVHGAPLRLAIYSTASSSPVLELTATEISYGAVPDSVFSFSPPPGAKVTDVEPPSNPPNAGEGAHSGTPRHVQGLAAVQAAIPFTLNAPSSLAGMARDEVQLVELNGHPSALVTYGQGLGGIAVLEGQKAGAGKPASGGESETSPQSPFGELPKVSLAGNVTATELPTELGTLLQFERSGVSYLIAGSVTPAVAQDAAKGL